MAGSSSSGGGSSRPPAGAGDMSRELHDIAEATKATAEAVRQLVTMGRFGANAGGSGGGGAGSASEPLWRRADRERREQFGERQRETYQRATAYSQAGMGGIGGRMSGYAAQAQGLHSLGMGGAARMLQGAAGPLAFGGAVLQAGAGAARIMHNSFATGDQKARSLFRMLPGGETMQGLHDSFSGRADAMARSAMYGQQEMLESRTNSRIAAMQSGSRIEQAGLSGTAGAYARGSAVTARVFDRGTASGEVAHADEQKLLGYRKESAKAERELAASTSRRVQTNRELVGLQSKQETLAKQLAKAESIADKEGSGPGRDFALRLASAKRAEYEQTSEQLVAMRQQSKEAGRGESQARAARDVARVREDMLGRADVLEGKAERSQATAQRLGGMGMFERERGLQALKMLQGGMNPDMMPDDMKAAAQSFAPAEFSKIIQKHGEGTSQFAEGKQMGLVGFEGKASDLQREADTLRQGAGEQEYKIESRHSAEAVAMGKDFGKAVAADLRIALSEAKKEIENQLRIARGHQ